MVNQKEITFYWENEVCGTRYSNKKNSLNFYNEVKKKRYKYETYIKEFLSLRISMTCLGFPDLSLNASLLFKS